MATPTRAITAQALAYLTVAFGLVFYLVGAAIKPGYSYSANFISELNASGTPWASLLGWGGFLPLGLLFASFLVAAGQLAQIRGARLGYWLLWSQPVARSFYWRGDCAVRSRMPHWGVGHPSCARHPG